ncbi:cupin domain-containing protein [Noviherbaspirillum sp. UKPF54]|uniref:cupin domain-containing protein n=1 Tax=Noviherbaspirillum sp. UKPF54 TaxID=2601898 RepID=UPI0011B18463|nr:cupin domain-containing protein [Noviherbaspirillum sp. UKPF54]QDZ29498.1 cupin domain-containing protein [Noviherbaspirillum sp. UKPF54]
MAHIPAALLGLGKLSSEAGDVTVATREGVSTQPHTHPTTNYVTVTEGTLYLTLDGAERAVRPGEWCTIPANTEHAERFVEKTSVIVFWVKGQSGAGD